MDPWGNYIKRYVPELAHMPVAFIYEPWKAPLEVQRAAGCVVGEHYPHRIVVHEEASKANAAKMDHIKDNLLLQMAQAPTHCGPSNEEETRAFMGFDENCNDHQHRAEVK